MPLVGAYEPAAQGKHAVAPPPEYGVLATVPAGHCKHTLLTGASPSPHMEHAVGSAVEDAPYAGGHDGAHAPPSTLYMPVAHVAHAAAEVEPWGALVPAGQFAHTYVWGAARSRYWPVPHSDDAVHGEHADAPAAEQYPVLHTAQSPPFSLYEFSAHVTHAEPGGAHCSPASGVHVHVAEPAAHTVHAGGLTYELGPHATHEPHTSSYEPAGHFRHRYMSSRTM